MKIIIALGMFIIFISVFFILFIFDSVVKEQIRCMAGFEDNACNVRESSESLLAGLGLITMFLIIDSGVLYIIIKSITSSGSSYIAYSI